MSCTFKIAIAAAFAAIALAPAAIADAGREVVFVRVAYGDLNLSSPAGAETLLKRIKIAARKVCTSSVTHSPLMPRSETTCRRETIGAVVARLDIGALTTAWNRTQPPRSQFAAR